MSTIKHTPGPWRVGDAGFTVFGPKTDAPSPKIIANVGRGCFPTERTKANARLIAAAPDLLAALEYWFDSSATPAELVKRAKAAIAKATGEPSG